MSVIQDADISDTFAMSDSATLFKILEALNFKGGSSSVGSLKIAVMMEEWLIKTVLKTGEILNFIEKDEDDYALTGDGERILEVSSKEQQDIMAKNLLAIEGYRDIVFRLKMNKEMQIKEVEKAFYILLPDTREELRKRIVDSFISFATYANVLESNNDKANPGVSLTSNGEKKLQEAIDAKKRKKKGGADTPAAGSGGIVSDLKCPSCGKGIMPSFMLCPYCGTSLKHECANCGKELQPGWKMCPFCGSPR